MRVAVSSQHSTHILIDSIRTNELPLYIATSLLYTHFGKHIELDFQKFNYFE